MDSLADDRAIGRVERTTVRAAATHASCCRPGSECKPDELWSIDESPAVEKAISFMATLAIELVGRGRHKLSVAIAGREIVELPNVQSRILVNDLLDHLASAASTAQKDALANALERLQASLVRNPLLIVVSTRSNVLPQLIREMPMAWASVCWSGSA